MTEFILFHIGDVHYPTILEEGSADDKDAGFDTGVKERIAPSRLNAVMEKLAADVTAVKPRCAFLFSGDITDKGDELHYQKFVQEISALCLDDIESSSVHVVPGNHDIKRALVPDKMQYAHMVKTWESTKRGGEVLPHDSVREETIPIGGDCAVTVLSLNTCVGCGAKRSVVGELKSKILELVPEDDVDDDDFYEKLDTPAVDARHIESVRSAISGNFQGKNLPVVLAHHNLLPQYQPRIEIYTELINSGALREGLLKAQNPVILCHGHVHDDPIEIIGLPDSRGKLIATSAPMITQGYNTISLFIGKRGYILGCRIGHVRMGHGTAVSRSNSYDIPFCKPADFLSKGDERLASLLEVLEHNIPVRGCDFRKMLKDFDVSIPQKKTLQKILSEALWFGLVDIRNIGEVDFDDWQIRKVFP